MTFDSPWNAQAVFFLLFFACTAVQASSDNFLEQSFYFSYDTTALPIPVTTQCDTIHVEWERSIATGPNPTAPYYLQIYTSAFVFPFIVSAGSSLSFDWEVPFAPGTLYQICMFDKNGNTGGCQATYTMIANTTATPTCANASFPLGPLDIEAEVVNGPLSQYGWIDQCTDISITPKNGTPPYIFTVAPALHPPYNLTISDMKSVNWTVALSWGSPFFISVVDSVGNFWANGPLHSGGNGPTACLDLDTTTSSPKVTTGVTIGVGVGGLIVGLLAGIIGAFFFFRNRRQRDHDFVALDHRIVPYDPPSLSHTLSSTSPSHYRGVPSGTGHLMDPSYDSAHSAPLSPRYEVEPFMMPGEESSRPNIARSPSSFNAPLPNPYSEQSVAHDTSSGSGGSGKKTQGGHVYVVHHDGGRAPVTVYHQDGTEVVELPPRYVDEPSGSGNDGRPRSGSNDRPLSGSDDAQSPLDGVTPAFLQQSRSPGTAPKKRRQTRPNPST